VYLVLCRLLRFLQLRSVPSLNVLDFERCGRPGYLKIYENQDEKFLEAKHSYEDYEYDASQRHEKVEAQKAWDDDHHEKEVAQENEDFESLTLVHVNLLQLHLSKVLSHS